MFQNENKKSIIPRWLKRELAVFGGMVFESLKFIIVAILVFTAVYAVINGPAAWNNVKWWWYVNYVDDHSGKWWGVQFPEIGVDIGPDNTLMIPKIGVQAPIVFAKTRAQSEVDKLLLEGVVHYFDTAFPGEEGNVFITGHSSYYWWSNGKFNTIFSILDKLVVGDIIYVNYGGNRYTYKVFDMKVVSPKELSVLNQNDNESILSLMTCTPVGTNYKRLVVRASQVDPDPKNNKLRKKVATSLLGQ
ncbi:MAG: class D sortase [Patescibacteria group bacterium]|nr:class D sortase [Patescibacteria group bacterium]